MPSLIALDVGAHAVKVTVLRRTGRKFEIEDRFSQPVPQDGESLPADEARFAALDALLDEHREWQSPGTEVAAVWPTEHATVRRVIVPFTDRAQIEKTLPFVIEGEVPFDLDEVVLAWRTKVGAVDTRALAVMVLREPFTAWLGALAERQVDPKVVTIDGDVLGAWSRGPELCAVVDVGHTHTVVSVVRSGVVETSRAIDVGGRDFTRAIQLALDCTWEEAEQIKHGQRGDGLSQKARQNVDAAMGVLLAEIRSTLITAEDALGGEIERLKLTGGGARMHPLPDYLRQDLGVPVEPIAESDGFPVPGEHAVSHALAMMLAGRSVGQEVDLRVGDLAYRGGNDVLRASATLLAAGVSFLTLAALVMFGVQFSGLVQEQALLDKRIGDIVVRNFPDVPRQTITNTTAESIMLGRVTEAKARAAVMGAGGAEPPTVALVLQLTDAFPRDSEVTVDVSELYITPGTVSIQAETDGYASASAVEEALQRVSRFKAAAKGSERKVRNKVAFSITIPLGGTDDDSEEEEG